MDCQCTQLECWLFGSCPHHLEWARGIQSIWKNTEPLPLLASSLSSSPWCVKGSSCRNVAAYYSTHHQSRHQASPCATAVLTVYCPWFSIADPATNFQEVLGAISNGDFGTTYTDSSSRIWEPFFPTASLPPTWPNFKVVQKLFREHMLCAGNPYKNIPLPEIRNHHNKNIKINRLIIAYHQPLNLGNLLCPHKFDRQPGHTVLEHMQIAWRYRRGQHQQQQQQLIATTTTDLTTTLSFGGILCFLVLFSDCLFLRFVQRPSPPRLGLIL